MDLSFISEFAVPVIVGICLCLGYVIKSSMDFVPNKYIPLIMSVIGVVLNVWISGIITPIVLLGGIFSGLSSTGLYEAFRNLIEKSNK